MCFFFQIFLLIILMSASYLYQNFYREINFIETKITIKIIEQKKKKNFGLKEKKIQEK